jgi:hypothetical protein
MIGLDVDRAGDGGSGYRCSPNQRQKSEREEPTHEINLLQGGRAFKETS